MEKLIISTESTSDISDKYRDKYSIRVAPMTFTIDGVEHRSDEGMSISEFCQKMKDGAVVKTTQITDEQAKEYLENLLLESEQVVHISFSKAMSGMCDSFCRAARSINEKYGSERVYIVDTACAAHGQMMVCLEAAKKAELGWSAEKIAQYASEIAPKINHVFIVDTLKYLARGGRISKAAAMLGNAVHLKVVLRVDDGGAIVPLKKVISRSRSVGELLKVASQKYSPIVREIYIGQADCCQEAEKIASAIEELVGVRPEVLDLGPVITGHSGPGTIAIFFTGESREVI